MSGSAALSMMPAGADKSTWRDVAERARREPPAYRSGLQADGPGTGFVPPGTTSRGGKTLDLVTRRRYDEQALAGQRIPRPYPNFATSFRTCARPPESVAPERLTAQVRWACARLELAVRRFTG